MKEATPKVSILMLAYNHGEFIAQAIEGVMAQKARFTLSTGYRGRLLQRQHSRGYKFLQS